MQIQLGYWTIQKADHENDKVVRVRMIANMLEPDKEGQEILPQAFNKTTVDDFLKNGVIDWFHKSITGRSNKEKSEAILGKPVDFKWEDGLPVVYADLTKAHPIVRDSILPHLEAENDVFGASVGGRVKKIKKSIKKAIDQVSEFVWQHLAIAPRAYIISGGSAVTMVKALDSGEDRIEFASISDFFKAMEAGFETDIANMTDHDALRPQSIEGGDEDKIIADVAKVVTRKEIPASKEGVMEYLKDQHNLQENEAETVFDSYRMRVRNGIKNISKKV